MGEIDNATWLALGLVMTVLGLVASALVWRRRGVASGMRATAWALLPLAAAMSGTMRLLWEIAGSIGTWGLRLVLSPVVWLGIVLAGVSVVLFVVSGVLRRLPSVRRTVDASNDRVTAVPRARSGKPAISGDDDMADIEALLKRHGIR